MDFNEKIMMGSFDVQNYKKEVNASLNTITSPLNLCLWFLSITDPVLCYKLAEAVTGFRSCKENL